MTSDRDYEFHIAKKDAKTYVSPRLDGGLRIASKVMDADRHFHEAAIVGEVVLRVTPGRRQEVVAKFFEDDRQLQVVTLQRWTVGERFRPSERVHFSFVG